MKVEKKVTPAVTRVVVDVPEKVEYQLTCSEDELHVLRSYLGQTASDKDTFDTYQMYNAVMDALGYNASRKFMLVNANDISQRISMKVRKNS